MEHVPGEDLERSVRRAGALPLSRACDVACQVAGALAEAHQQGLIHRDIKPSNILLTPEGQAKLLDFGLVRCVRDSRRTEPGVVLGSLDYMPPEQACAGTVDHRADLYALGGVLYWCLTGKTPFPTRDTFTEQLLARQNQEPPSLLAARPEVPPELAAVLGRLMALRPEDRFPTAQAVVNALLPFLEMTAPHALPSAARLPNLPRAAAGPVRALVADDDPVGRLLCRRVLEGAGDRLRRGGQRSPGAGSGAGEAV
jgi:serine/threonine protein kinase